MKNKFSTLFGFAALALLVSGCSKDSVDTAEVLQQDEVRYVSIMIGDAAGFGSRTDSVDGDYGTGYDYDGTKDPNFQEGTTGDYKENEINSLYLLFYDEDDNRVGGSMLVDQSSLFKNITLEEPQYGSVYERRVGIVQINLSKGEKVPDKVVAIINPVASEWASPRFQAGLSKLSDLETLVQEQVVTSRGFAMSNSVYYENESAAAPIVAAKIIGDNLYKSEKKAQDALDSVEDGDYSSVLSFDIYVERYAVKVNFSLAEEAANNEKEAYFVSEVGDDSSFSNDATCKLKFTPEYWWVNAQEPEAYVVKSLFKVESGQTVPSSTYLSYGELNAAINPAGTTGEWKKWNSPESHRSYWAQSPAYYSKTYPRVSDDIMDDKNGTNSDEYDYDEEGEKMIHYPSHYSLKYYTYNEIADSNDPAYDVPAAGKYAKQYVRENTMASSVLASENLTADKYYNYKAAIPSIVMVGRYTIEGTETLENETFYVRGSETNDYYVFTEEAMNKLFRLNTEGIVGVKNGNNYEAVPENTFIKYFDMIHPSEATRAKVGTSDELVIDARFVTMQTKEGVDFSGSGIYVRLESGWAEVNADNIYTLNRMLITTLGLARKFNTGLAYFNIPIKHLRFNLGKGSDIIEPTSKEFEWDKVRVGDFGLVRNHIYTINVSSITGLGTGISNPDDPIVPPVDEEEYYAASRVNILNWAVVPTQNVDL